MPLQNNAAIGTEIQLSNASIETQSVNLIRPYFSLDVKPTQKNIYKSDQFNQRRATKTNGYIRRIQGIKNSVSQSSSVWPRVRVSGFYRYSWKC